MKTKKELQDGYSHVCFRAFQFFKTGRQREQELEDLIAHCWVHSGYENCGYRKMTAPQKRLYKQVIENQCKDV